MSDAERARLRDIAFRLGRRAHPVGLSADVISKEEKYMATRQALAMSAIMPDQLDRNLLADRFYNAELSISDLARKHGGRSPASMANYLRKLLGTEDEPGSLSSVRDAFGELSLKTADACSLLLCLGKQ